MSIDIVTVYHNPKNKELTERLHYTLALHSDIPYRCFAVSNIEDNIGFGPACNKGASQGDGEIIGFLNPDVKVHGYLGHSLYRAFQDPNVVIAGESFGKPKDEYLLWGCRDWVCGAAMFVRRGWFDEVGGFDEYYKWSWEETDLVRTAQEQGKRVISIRLPLSHSSPLDDSPADAAYKRHHFERGAAYFYNKWGKP